jgi:acetyl-CoA acyltransferase 2
VLVYQNKNSEFCTKSEIARVLQIPSVLRVLQICPMPCLELTLLFNTILVFKKKKKKNFLLVVSVSQYKSTGLVLYVVEVFGHRFFFVLLLLFCLSHLPLFLLQMRRDVFIVAAKRTAFGTFGGMLKNITATELGAAAARGAIAQIGGHAELINNVFFGNVAHTDVSGPYIARHVALKAGVPQSVPALTVNRLCGSGFQSVVSATQDIWLNESEVVLAGGAESMSQAPFQMSGPSVRWGAPLGTNLVLEDSLWATLTDQHVKTPMGLTAENLAVSHHISRESCDAFALQSQQRFAAAQASNAFGDEIVPFEVKTKKGVTVFDKDEHNRPQTTMESLAKLSTSFKKDGVVTAGNASGISDGAGALILASAEACKKHNLVPLARVVNWGIAGVDPKIMGIGPVPAIQQLLAKTKLSIADIGLFEVNEAFASQFLAVEKDLGLPRERTNVNGGAIACGHPTGASGARILGHLTYQFKKSPNVRYAIGSACIGGGQGIAVLLERV